MATLERQRIASAVFTIPETEADQLQKASPSTTLLPLLLFFHLTIIIGIIYLLS